MTKDNMIRLAKEAGLVRAGDGWTEPARWGLPELERFAERVLAAERNHIAGVFDDNHEVAKHRNNYWLHAANYVRARSQS